MSDKVAKILEVCKTMYSLDFSIQLNKQDILITQDETTYLSVCTAAIQKWQTAPSIVTPSHLRTISEFAKAHGFKKVTLALPPHPMAYHDMGSDGKENLFLGVVQLFFKDDEEVVYVLEHELGHLRDLAVVMKMDPLKRKKMLEKGSPTNHPQIEGIAQFLSVINQAQPEKEREEFTKLASPIINQFLKISPLHLFTIITEAFRYGEEIRSPWMKLRAPREIAIDTLRNAANTPSSLEKLIYALFIARLQEMGFWETALQKLSKDDQDLVKKIPPEYIAFFRTIIHVSAKIPRPAID